MKATLGSLFAAGFRLGDLDRMSWDQVFFVGECLAEKEVQRLDMLLSPLAAAFGADRYEPGHVDIPGRDSKPAPRGRYSDMSPEAVRSRAVQRDARIYAAAHKHGIGIYDGPRSE